MKLLILMSGGAIGTLLRYFTYELTKRMAYEVNYWGTLSVNITGALVIGFLWGFLDVKQMNPQLKNFIFVGLLGGYTTFSTYALDAMNLSNSGNYKVAFSYLLGSNILAFSFVFAGFIFGKFLNGV